MERHICIYEYEQRSHYLRRPGRLGENVRGGALFVFTNKRRTRLKVLYFDGTGLWLMTKRLEQGTFRFPAATAGHGVEIRSADLTMLLDGVDLESVKRQRRYRRPQPADAPAAP